MLQKSQDERSVIEQLLLRSLMAPDKQGPADFIIFSDVLCCLLYTSDAADE